jgi:putative membrane protein
VTRANALWTICLLFTLYTIGTGLFPGFVPGGIDGLALTVFVLVFALVHGSARYGWRGILVFVAICLVVSNASENLSILTGMPFGRYTYTDVLGAKLFHVPVIIGGAYAGTGYLSWIVAQVLIDRMSRSDGFAVWALPLVGALLMVAWDMSFDPSASTIAKSWIWLDGGPFFGVPLRNFFGWYLTVLLFLLPFAWYQSQLLVRESTSRAFWMQAIVMYVLLGLRYPLLYSAGATAGRSPTPPAMSGAPATSAPPRRWSPSSR